MRYLLMILGFLAVLLGLYFLEKDRIYQTHGSLLIQGGAVFLAVGLATVDIIEALRERKE